MGHISLGVFITAICQSVMNLYSTWKLHAAVTGCFGLGDLGKLMGYLSFHLVMDTAVLPFWSLYHCNILVWCHLGATSVTDVRATEQSETIWMIVLLSVRICYTFWSKLTFTHLFFFWIYTANFPILKPQIKTKAGRLKP
ncbi:hypothetical protein ACJX0J_024633, partial [Zea mays]